MQVNFDQACLPLKNSQTLFLTVHGARIPSSTHNAVVLLAVKSSFLSLLSFIVQKVKV